MAAKFLDIQDGHMILRGKNTNRNYWRTAIECLLRRTTPEGEVESAWLSHECRAERVSADIFDMPDYEFVGVKSWRETLSLRNGPALRGFNPIQNAKLQTPYHNVGRDELDIEVYGNERPVYFLDSNELLKLLQSKETEVCPKVFMKIEFNYNDRSYELYAPCKYMNYAPGEGNGHVQPITGYIIFPDGESLVLGYVAAHVRDNETLSVQFRVRNVTGVIKSMNARGKLAPIFRFFDRLFMRFFVVSEELCKVVVAEDAKCSFFVYENYTNQSQLDEKQRAFSETGISGS